jgi:hypothetical protein
MDVFDDLLKLKADFRYKLTGLAACIANNCRDLHSQVFSENGSLRYTMDTNKLDELEEMIKEYRETLNEFRTLLSNEKRI